MQKNGNHVHLLAKFRPTVVDELVRKRGVVEKKFNRRERKERRELIGKKGIERNGSGIQFSRADVQKKPPVCFSTSGEIQRSQGKKKEPQIQTCPKIQI